MKTKNVIAFSATTSPSHERILFHCVKKPMSLKFISEYEMIHEVSPVSVPNIILCKNEKQKLETLFIDIEGLYDKKPIIVIHNFE